MKWCEVSIQTSHEATEIIAEIFRDLGAGGVVIEDPELVNDYITSGKWDYTDIPIATETEVVTEKAYLVVNGELEGRLQTFKQEIKALGERGVNIAPALTTRGFKEADFEEVANIIALALDNPEDEKCKEEARQRVAALCAKYPLYE